MNTSAEPVVNLCEVKNPPLTVEESKRFKCHQRLLRSSIGILIFVLIALTIGSSPVIVMVPGFFFLHWLNTYEESKKSKYHQLLLHSTISILIFFLIAFSTVPPSVIVLVLVIYLLYWLSMFTHRPIRRFFDLCTGNWITVMTLYFEWILGIRVRTFGFNGMMKKRCVIIMNHVSHLDWMFLWSVVDRQGSVSYWKPITKNMMRRIPLIGWCMEMCAHIFVNRKWEHDEPELRKKLYYLNGINYPCQLLIFPEGGDYTYKTKQRSNEFADKEGYPHYQYCIHPRTTGFVYVMNALRSGGLDAVYDVTIAYPDALAKTELDFFKGVIPREIHFHIKSYDDKSIPEDDEGLAQWCRDRWEEKEERLKNFYTHGKFQDGCETQSNSNGVANGTYPVSNSSTLHDSPEVFRPKNNSYLLYSIFIFISTNAFVVFIVSLKGGFIYFMFGIAYLYYISKYGGGLDYFFMGFKDKETEAAFRKNKKHYKPQDSSLVN